MRLHDNHGEGGGWVRGRAERKEGEEKRGENDIN